MADQLAPAEVRRRKGSVGAVEIQGPNGVVKTVNLEGLDDADQALAAEFGYKPVFKREFGYLSTFSFAVSISGLFSTVATTFSYPLYAGGSASAVWCWLISGLGLLRFRACFGIPYLWRPVGLPYYTISRTAPKAWVPSVSWVTGWLNLLGQVAGVASSEWGAAALLLAAVSMGSDFAYTPTVGQTVGVMAGLTVITGLVNSLSTYWMEKMTKSYVIFHILVLVTCSIALLALSKQAGTNHTAKYVFTDVENTSGWTPTGWSFMFGFLSVSWTMTDYDATAHITEEIKDPAVKAPWAISMAMLFTYVAGWLFNIVLCFVMGDIASILASPMQQPVAQIFYNVLGKAGGIVFTVCAFIIIKFVTFTAMQALARTVFAFSRDRLVPFSSLWTKILPLTGTPILAVWISVFWCIAINLIGLGSYTAIAGVFNVCAIALDWSYCIPIVCKLAFGKFERGPWHLGKFSPFINAWACIWTLFVSIIFVMPTALPVTAMTMNYAIVYLGAILFFSMLYWVVRGRKFYTGPLIEAEIGEDMSQQTRSSDDDDVNRKTEKYGEIIG
ncbi:polyamine transporter tpo5 [Friedmanniomyces endolithicus]|nr:polyamine transporter tpo5 [Friedmanniomyces endolithicus]KAK0827731.1 polyamine transporter tpo5 [Friedmanniomyces endolithicus]